jgi:hypothetical protein
MLCGGNSTGGSNPPSSAFYHLKLHFKKQYPTHLPCAAIGPADYPDLARLLCLAIGPADYPDLARLFCFALLGGWASQLFRLGWLGHLRLHPFATLSA